MDEIQHEIRNFQAQSNADDLSDGVDFVVTDRRPFDFEGRHHAIEVAFAGRVTRTLRYVKRSSDPDGYVVAVNWPNEAANVHLTIVDIGLNRFRIVLPDHLASGRK